VSQILTLFHQNLRIKYPPDSIKSASKSAAKGLISYYNGTKSGEIPGLYGQPYFWWSSGAIWDSLIDYWFLTGDSQYNEDVAQALQFQLGPNNDFMPMNQTKSEVGASIDTRLTYFDSIRRAMMTKIPGLMQL
jgi:hypothetical protein